MVQEGAHDPNVTLQGTQRNSGVCLVRKVTKHNKSCYPTQREGLSLALPYQQQTYNSNL